jgi:uncharacterized protein GlcG (DUF336 family)
MEARTDLTETTSMTLKQAELAVEAAEAKAKEIGTAVSIAAGNTSGHIKTFRRIDRTGVATIDIAIKKAKTSVLFKMETQLIGEHSGDDLYGIESSYSHRITFAGGIPLRSKSIGVFGAAGVSGGVATEDYAVDQARKSAVDDARKARG